MLSRRGQETQDKVKTPQDASEKSNILDPQASLKARSRRSRDVSRSPHTEKTRSKRAKDACVLNESPRCVATLN